MLQSNVLQTVNSIEHGFTTKKTSDCVSIEKNGNFAKQVHGDQLVWLDQPFAQGEIVEADALATSVPKVSVGVRSADCCPILVAGLDSKNKVLGIMAIHAGWRGTAKKITQKSIQAFSQKVQPYKIFSSIGPTISGEKYEVGNNVVEAMPWIEWQKRNDRYFLDIAAENQRQLEDVCFRLNLGLVLDVLSQCTFANHELFPSYRRDGKGSGRILSWIRF